MPPAISGQGGHDATFAVARALVHGFALADCEAWPILWNTTRVPATRSEYELQHKLSAAGNFSRPCKPRGHLLDGEEVWRTQKHFPSAPKSESSYWNVRIEPLPGKKNQIDRTNKKAISEEHTEPAPARAVRKAIVAQSRNTLRSEIGLAGELRQFNDAGALRKPEDPRAKVLTGDAHLGAGAKRNTRPSLWRPLIPGMSSTSLIPRTWRNLTSLPKVQVKLTVDTREPWPHPWTNFLPAGWEMDRGTLETGDVALSALQDGAVIDAKRPATWPAASARIGNASRRS